jgi:hypothetical protein
VAAAELRDFFWKIADCFRVFRRKALYRRRGGVRGGPGPPHHRATRSKGGATLGCGCPLAPLRLSFGLRPSSGKIGVSVFVSSNSENISCVAFLKHKKSRKQGTGTVASCQKVSSRKRIKMPRSVNKT